jgi:Flp pilus assembly pilin Flp
MTKEKIHAAVRLYWADEAGVTAVDYGIMLAFLSIAIVGGSEKVWMALKAQYEFISTFLAAA